MRRHVSRFPSCAKTPRHFVQPLSYSRLALANSAGGLAARATNKGELTEHAANRVKATPSHQQSGGMWTTRGRGRIQKSLVHWPNHYDREWNYSTETHCPDCHRQILQIPRGPQSRQLRIPAPYRITQESDRRSAQPSDATTGRWAVRCCESARRPPPAPSLVASRRANLPTAPGVRTR